MEMLDLQTIGGAVGALLMAAYLAWKGYNDNKKEPHTIVSGVIQDNVSIRENTEQLREVRAELRHFNEKVDDLVEQMRLNQAAFTRFTDIILLQQQVGRSRE